MNDLDRFVAREVDRATADYRRAAQIIGDENTRLRRANGGLRGMLKQARHDLRTVRTFAGLPRLDMNDPQIVDKLLTLTKGTK